MRRLVGDMRTMLQTAHRATDIIVVTGYGGADGGLMLEFRGTRDAPPLSLWLSGVAPTYPFTQYEDCGTVVVVMDGPWRGHAVSLLCDETPALLLHHRVYMAVLAAAHIDAHAVADADAAVAVADVDADAVAHADADAGSAAVSEI